MNGNSKVVKKQLLRYTIEQPINNAVVKPSKCNNGFLACGGGTAVADRVPKTKNEMNDDTDFQQYKKPQLQTTMELAKRIQQLHALEINRKSNKHSTNVKKDKTQKLNFPTNKNVYKDLIPINVHDYVLELHEIEKKQLWKRANRMTIADKDPEPILTDYLKSVKPFNINATVDHTKQLQYTRTNLENALKQTKFIDNSENILDAFDFE